MSVVVISPLGSSPPTRSASRASLRVPAPRPAPAHVRFRCAVSPVGHDALLLEQREAGGESVEERSPADWSHLAGTERTRERQGPQQLVDQSGVVVGLAEE